MNSFLVGTNGVSPTTYSFAGYQPLTGIGITRYPHSISSNPAFADVAGLDLNITGSCSAATSAGGDGLYMGAFRPDQINGKVGNEDTDLIDF